MDEFKKILNEHETVLVDFYADWCGPCKMYAPVIAEFKEKHPEIYVYKVNVDEQGMLAAVYSITSIPTTLLFKNGKLLKTKLGYNAIEQLEQFVK